ncbi:MAG: diguanylate cyclase [Betaproteobacteria bacterium]|nr:diguanylate cyclase [Betaproteobacteria bacterium]
MGCEQTEPLDVMPAPFHLSPYNHLLLPVVAAWALVVTASLLWNIRQVDHSIETLALAEARFHFEKDVLYRRWASSHGGVYVPVSEKTPPNPYLSHVAERDVVTPSGRRLTLINPAYMTRQVNELASDDGVIGHITSLKPLRPENRADAWETRALHAFENGAHEYGSLEDLRGQPYFRYMRPFRTESACLKCHAEQGYKEGDIRGGVSMSLPYSRYANHFSLQRRNLLLGHGLIGLLGLVGMGFGARRLVRIKAALVRSEAETERLTVRKSLLSSLGEGVYDIDNAGRCTFINPAALTMLGYQEHEVVGQDPHRLFHRRNADGSPHPASECMVFQTRQDGVRREVQDTFLRKNGLAFPVRLTVTPVHRNGEIVGAVVAFQDISERLAMEQELMRLATTDPLTGAANRRRFLEQMEIELARVHRHHDSAALLMMDLDHFKQVNDAHGHASGDIVLRHFTSLAKPLLRRTDLFGRLGGEEFAILLSGADLRGAAEFAERFRSVVAATPAQVEDGEIPYTVSIGVTVFQAADGGADCILARADAALYRAKQAGRNTVALVEAT